jgi:Ca-activated chloride channel family protein
MKRLALLWALFATIIPSAGYADQAKLNLALSQPVMKAGAEGKTTNYLHISLTGFELPNQKDRPKANVAIVIDKSGSMQGDKIAQARRAAISAVERLSSEDIVSIVTYDDNVDVLVPATKVSDPELIKQKINSIDSSGSTALFAGTSKGAAEVRKFLDKQRVNRVILLSDGLANVGPSSPSELEELGASLIKEGISVTTMGLGLGYNEDLMTRLAMAGNGNHVFIESADTLVGIFQREFDSVMSVVAKDIKIHATLAEGIRPVRVLNSEASIEGQTIDISLGQLYANQERYFVVEVEVPVKSNGSQIDLASVDVSYSNLQTNTVDKLGSKLAGLFSDDVELVDKSFDKKVRSDCILQIANEKNRLATALRDSGNIDEARQILQMNCTFLSDQHKLLGDRRLEESSLANGIQSSLLDETKWSENRKFMRQRQYGDSTNQPYSGASELAK